ncbi:hypothetical protein AWB80_08086 [Caballeronia pedi]|uniref:Uncharacterized protein n=1 Tax=Caballeronia pedi TaxID=1777141 RepID=A0A158E392_9BURK|nr:hypothetical protein AWB80_08086 [Caballeronia pedi]
MEQLSMEAWRWRVRLVVGAAILIAGTALEMFHS